MTDNPYPGAANTPGPAAAPSASWGRRVAMRWLKRVIIATGLLLFLSGVAVVLAERQTSKPKFCGSCHIMEPYFESWHNDLHGGKLDVACVECHYAPGEKTTIEAKLRGLSQVTSYVSGRYGKSRPRAHVDNRSCMTAKCHGDLRFMDKEIHLGNARFKHAKHLQEYAQKQEANQRELADATEKLRKLLGNNRLQEVENIVHEATPYAERNDRLAKLAGAWNIKFEPRQLEEFSHLHHREVRLAQLADLQCTNCHSYVAPEPQARGKGVARHFTVKTTTCFTCHFNNEGFNTGTSTCLMCHTLPAKEIMVHQEVSTERGEKLKSPELAKRAVSVDHQTILKQKVDCSACHADVATENAPVTRRDCERCHDRPEYFAQWKVPLPLTVAQQYHAQHVPEQHAKCLDCHAEIHHQLVKGKSATGQPQFLSTVMNDCTHCHPKQHSEQIDLLSGTGGTGVAKGEANLMFGSRTNCYGCHVEKSTDKHGGTALRGNQGGCIACHGDKHSGTFEKWKQGLTVYLTDAEEAMQKAQAALKKANTLTPETRSRVTELLEASQADYRLVKRGNGVHNVMYSIELLESVTKRCQQAAQLIAKDKPAKKQ